MRTRFAVASLLAPFTIIVACSSSSDNASTGSTTPNGGSAGTAQAGSSGAAQAGASGATQGGAAGTAQAGSGGGGAAGAGGATTCGCATVKCGGAHPICIEGDCFDLKPGECFSANDCAGKNCVGATICPCDKECVAPTKPGKCEGAGDWATCGVPGDCAIAGKGCCSPCGAPTLKDVDAVNKTKLASHFNEVCTTDPMCPGCPSAPNPDLMAVCALGQGKCQAIEVSTSFFSACKADADCALVGNTCCGCGELSPSAMLAVAKSANASYMAELGCSNVDCAPCVDPQKPPAGYGATCDLSTGHCKITKP